MDGRIQELESNKAVIDEQMHELEKGLHVKADKESVKTIDDRLRQLEERLKDHTNTQVPESQGAIKKTVEKLVTQQIGEDKEIAARKLNIVLYRVPESSCRTQEENKNDDINFFELFCQEGLGVDVKGNDVSKIFRLGKKETDKVRPLLIGLKDQDTKSLIMKNLKNLKDAINRYKQVSVAHDLTPLQRQQVKVLLEQSKEQEATCLLYTSPSPRD